MSLPQFIAACAFDAEARRDDPDRLFVGDLCVVENGVTRRATFADVGAKTAEEAYRMQLPAHVMMWNGERAVSRN